MSRDEVPLSLLEQFSPLDGLKRENLKALARKAALEEHGCKDCDQDCRNRRYGCEQRDQTNMQLAATETALFGSPQRDLACVKCHERDRGKEDCNQQQCNNWRGEDGPSPLNIRSTWRRDQEL